MGTASPAVANTKRASSLALIKLVHTLVWAFFAGAIVAIPIAAWHRWFAGAAVLAAVVMAEVVVLALNGLRCPLTSVAERYTEDRRNNFDIYLPLWLATYNKQVFGGLYLASLVFALVRWVQR
jgi:hypothetical protein